MSAGAEEGTGPAASPGRRPERRDAYLAEALPWIPSLLQLLDRDPLSPSHGCFDRSWWHFRTMDFPSGMAQEAALPLALVWKHPFPGSPWHREPRLREWVLAAAGFAARSAHADGSCDDYYPFERALGAAVYSLYALSEALALVGGADGGIQAFLARRAGFVATRNESGVLANHHAIAAAALAAAARATGDDRWLAPAREKAAEVLRHQHAEGWFLEYEGFDPGYQTVTVDFLARYWKATGDDRVMDPLERAVRILERVQHPDGTFGGEYGSRNSYHALPHGFELLAPRFPAAGRIADRLLAAFAAGRRARNDDDRLLAHHVYPCLQAWLDHQPRASEPPPDPPAERTFLPGCGFHLDRAAGDLLVAGLRKGGPFRAWKGGRLVANDSGVTLRLAGGSLAASHAAHDAEAAFPGGAGLSRGRFHALRAERMTPFRSVLLRGFMLLFGRWSRTLVRRLLQRKLILGRKPAPFRFERRIEARDGGWTVTDTLEADPGAPEVLGVHLGVGQTAIYTAVSHPWEAGWLLPWTEVPEAAAELNRAGRAVIVRRIPDDGSPPGLRT